MTTVQITVLLTMAVDESGTMDEIKQLGVMQIGLGKVMLLPLREPPVPKVLTDAEKTAYPALTFLREHELEKEVIKMLGERNFSYVASLPSDPPHFGLIPAIRHVRNVMTDWDLRKAKDFVEKIYKDNACQIDAARVACTESWRKLQ